MTSSRHEEIARELRLIRSYAIAFADRFETYNATGLLNLFSFSTLLIYFKSLNAAMHSAHTLLDILDDHINIRLGNTEKKEMSTTP